MGYFLASLSLAAVVISLVVAQDANALLAKTFKVYQNLSRLQVKSIAEVLKLCGLKAADSLDEANAELNKNT